MKARQQLVCHDGAGRVAIVFRNCRSRLQAKREALRLMRLAAKRIEAGDHRDILPVTWRIECTRPRGGLRG